MIYNNDCQSLVGICACEVPVNDWNPHAAYMNQTVEVTEQHCIEGYLGALTTQVQP